MVLEGLEGVHASSLFILVMCVKFVKALGAWIEYLTEAWSVSIHTKLSKS